MIEITTNNVPREVHDDWNQEGEQNDSYIMYKGERYDLDDFQSCSGLGLEEFRNAGWDGYINWTYFSGIVLKWVPGTDWEQVIIGRWFVNDIEDSPPET